MPAILAVLKPLKGPFRQLSYSEAEQMVAENRAMRPDPRGAPGVFYELQAPVPAPAPAPVPAPKEQASTSNEETEKPQTYATRDMTAAPKTTSVRRRTRSNSPT